MADYGTDLTTLTDADSGTWVEFTPYNAGGAPAQDGENFIQGADCVSQTTGTKTGLVFSIAYDAGADISGNFNTDDVVLMWTYFSVGADLWTYALGGMRIGIGASVTALDSYYTGGNDRKPNPYGGWYNIAVDPTRTTDLADGGGNAGAWQYFGSIVALTLKIAKGAPHAVDAIRYGRAEIWCTGTTCSFVGMAEYNDFNDITNGYNRLGLFQDAGGTYLWKGLLSIGQSVASSTFSDSNQTIVIDDAAKTYLGFNKVEFHHVSTDVTWNNISFVSTGIESPGQLEMVDNATVNMSGCLFVEMDTFLFQSNANILSSTFQGCKAITSGGGTFIGSKVLQSSVTGTTASSFIWDETIDPDGYIDEMEFSSGSTLHHAIYFGDTIPSSITLTSLDFDGFNPANDQINSTLYFADTGGTITVNLVTCTGDISYTSAGAIIILVADPVTTEIIVKDSDTQNPISGVTAFAWVTDGTNFPYLASVTITGATTTASVHHVGHGLNTNDTVWIQGTNLEENYVGAYDITAINDDYYSYTTAQTIVTSPATGPITSTFCFFNGLTDVNGVISDARVVSANQPFAYRCRKSTTSPLYKQGTGSDIVDSALGKSITVNLVSDE